MQYQKFYGCEVLFKQADYQLVLSLESLNLQPQQSDPSLIHLLTKQAEEAIASRFSYETLDQQLHMRVAEYLRLQNSVPKIEQIATALHISSRTLQRQLNDRNSSFKKIVEIERMKRCEQLLLQNFSLTEISM